MLAFLLLTLSPPQLNVKEARSILQCCRDHGVNFFDAEVYANGRTEEIMGQFIRELGWRCSDSSSPPRSSEAAPAPTTRASLASTSSRNQVLLQAPRHGLRRRPLLPLILLPP
ncbi:hypothetical protein MLD38_021354 [Melastoma candidum]|uniref:Uncharacterized protein n=1 Tax=Melastoma candidum TaxID=119954 RepID=A0ACB9QNZ2_9MYRT|nr:hypothetical protein MLD38_021354 [Melastoma candidum]